MKSSRRSFLLSVAGAPLVARLGAATTDAEALAIVPPPGQMQFENPQIIRYDAKCFTIQGKDTLVMSGALHYARCPKALWRDRLQKLKVAGFNTVESYVFWNYHEPEEGKVDLAEFEEFAKLVQEMGFMMIARPGPYICAEWERGGFPSWVAAKRFPLRSTDPQSVATSQHWFKEILPVIQLHQVTLGGPIVMVQIENEYDFRETMPAAEKLRYIDALAQMAWSAGINVPLITCWTKQARENTNADMAKVMDTCNFYPRWKIVPELTPALQALRREEPNSPLAITELQGGWFSEFGGKLSVDQEGVNAAQIDVLTKTALELGVTSFSYYMAFGGTNFAWAAKNLTTTYDYAAPIREPGGLWDKFYTVRGIGHSLRAFGTVLARAVPVDPAQSTNANVSLTERSNGPSGVLFLRENANAPQRCTVTFVDPHSPSKRLITTPRQGQLELSPREMKMLPVQIPVSGGRLCYSTGELLAHGVNLDRDFVILYDVPGRTLELGLPTEEEPKTEGDTLYRYWDEEFETSVLGVLVGTTEKMLLHNQNFQVFVAPKEKALRTLLWEFPPKVVPDSEETKPVVAPIFTDAYSLGDTGTTKNRAWIEVEFLPGEHDVAVMLPPVPSKFRLDGAVTGFQYDRPWHLARVHVSTPALPVSPIGVNGGDVWVERFDTANGEWLSGPLRALEDVGPAPYGYVKYRAKFEFNGQPKMFLASHADDLKRVFINGKPVPEAAKKETLSEFPLAAYAQPGSNLVEVAYECFGAPNGGPHLGELKGLESVGLGATLASAQGLENWQMQRYPALLRAGAITTDVGAWTPGSFLASAESPTLAPAFTWCRTKFTLPSVEPAWQIPWKLTFEADHDALIYLNGKFVGRFVTEGPQREFYLPEPYLAATGENQLVFVLAYTDQSHHVRTLQVGPYPEFSVRRSHLEFEW